MRSFQRTFYSLQLKIEGIRGASYRGDIAIDDISVADGSCGGTVPPTPTPGPTGCLCHAIYIYPAILFEGLMSPNRVCCHIT